MPRPVAALLIVMLAALVLGAASVVAGVYLLLGLGWALVAAGVALLVGAGLLQRGLSANA